MSLGSTIRWHGLWSITLLGEVRRAKQGQPRVLSASRRTRTALKCWLVA